MVDERQNISGSMNEKESLEAFVDGSRKCVGAAREMARLFTDPEWASTADMLEDIATSGKQLSTMRSMSRIETLMAANIKTQKYSKQS